MKHATSRSTLRTGATLALALLCTFAANPIEAVPYASMIRFGEPILVGPNLNVDMSYTLNEDADTVEVELYNASTFIVVRTYNFTSPDTETTRGRHTITWDGLDDATDPVIVGGNEFAIRVRVVKADATTDWTLITNNSSGDKATQQTSIFTGYSPNSMKIPVDPTSYQFGLLLVSHAFSPAPPAGFVLFGTDLEPIIGDGGGPLAVKGQYNGGAINNQAIWNTNFDPIDPNLIWWGGQAGTHRAGVFNISALDPNDIQEVSDVLLTTTSPRSLAVTMEGGERVGYLASGNAVQRATMAAAYPHEITGALVTVTAATIAGVTRYASDIQFDSNGNMYFLSRLGGGLSTDSSLWRWDAADVAAAPTPLLSEANAAWFVTFPAGVRHGNALHVDNVTGEVYVSANFTGSVAEPTPSDPRGVWRVGNTATATLGTPASSTPFVLTAAEQILDFDDPVQFPVGYSGSNLGNTISTDAYGNMYVTTRSLEEIHSFSPPGGSVIYDITTESPDTLSDDLLLITLDSFAARSGGVGYPVRIRWTTGTEIDNVGFHLNRVRFEGGTVVPAGRVNTSLIPAAGTSGDGATYTYLDSLPLADGESRGYFLIDIDANGNTNRNGPFRVHVRPADDSGEQDWMMY